MKKGIVSVVIAVIAIYIVYLKNRNALITLSQESDVTTEDIEYYSEIHILDNMIYLIPIMVLGLLGLIIGVISVKQKNKIGIVGIILSLAAMILFFVPIWKYFIDIILVQ